MIEANRVIYRDKAKVVPIMVAATQSTPDAVTHAWDVLTRNCVWAINAGFDRKRTEWTIDYDVSVGDIRPEQKPTFEQVVNLQLAEEAVAAAGGPVKIGNCTE
jgi:NitT/TauT family transport system substrate-binding protein